MAYMEWILYLRIADAASNFSIYSVDYIQFLEYTYIERTLTEDKMSNTVTIRKRPRKDGTASLILDIYCGSQAEIDSNTGKTIYNPIRERRTINGYIYLKPRNKQERQHNKETMALAEEIRKQEEYRLASSAVFDKSDLSEESDFYMYYQDYVDCYFKKDKRHLTRALMLFQDYLKSIRKYRHFAKRLEFSSITRQMIEGYTGYLQERFSGEGPHTVYARFKKVMKNAVLDGKLNRNPCDGVVISCDQGQISKDTLTRDEIRLMMETHYKGENDVIRRAFIFCLFTGVRGCDVRALTYEHISADNVLRFSQQKTEGHSSASMVSIPMTQFHKSIIGQIPQNKKTLIFPLPTDTTCNKHLKLWVKATGIEKHITWHCARHSFGTNLCEKDVNPMTIMRLMGHSSLKYTNRYVRVRDKAKVDALEVLCPAL